jgi:hypothetical protein
VRLTSFSSRCSSLLSTVLPYVGCALRDMGLGKGERQELHLKGAPPRKAVMTCSWAFRVKGQR